MLLFRASRRFVALLLLVALVGLIACLPERGPPSAQEPEPGSPKPFFVTPDGDDFGGGTESAPFRTIAAAAKVARAGDVVRIRPGTYAETVQITGEGSRDRPIIFEAEVPGTVIVSGKDAGFSPLHWAGDHDTLVASGNRWVTLRGITFRGIHNPASPPDWPGAAVRASTGWRIENCLFEDVSFGINIRGHDVTVTESIFQDIDSSQAHALEAYGGRNLRLTDLVIRRINQARMIEDIAFSAVLKILAVDGLLIERVISRDNIGPGLWLDSNNKNFIIRQNYLSGNAGARYEWEGPGLWVELNHSANGLIYENVITHNSGAGIEIMESNGIEVYNNTFLGNDVCVGLRNLDRGAEFELGDIRIHHNLCGNSKSAGVATGVGDWTDWDPASHRMVIDNGAYLISPGTPIFEWLEERVMTLQDATAKFGLEAHGVALEWR